ASLTVDSSTFSGNYYGVTAYNGQQVALTNDTFTGQTLYPIVMNALTNATINLNGTSGSSNGDNAVALYGSLSSDTTLTPVPGIPNYVLNSDLTVNQNVTLTLPPGTIVKAFVGGVSVNVNGHLVAHGTAAQPIVFTSIRDDSIGGDTNNDASATQPAAGN